ncbi:MAG TPA: UDP-N-acetylmuramate dehydrogenase [Polyangia bacterium]|jgi:UDP-N-acetylmuramate dehydrogenase
MIGRDAILAAAGGAEVRFDEPLARHTTLRVGGPADALVFPETAAQVAAVRRLCAAQGWPCRALGAGSNLLVRDGGVRGVLIATAKLRQLERLGADAIAVGPGVATGKLLAAATGWELGGVEFLAGVPGTVGGGVIMNAGTTLGEFKDVVVEVTTVRADGAAQVRDGAACGFAYRRSAIGPDEVVTGARLVLTPRPRAVIAAAAEGLRAQRRGKEPHGVASAGSIFKNPPGDYAGRLIEQCGLKGRAAGAAEVSPVHANWIVNRGGARAKDVLALVALCRDEVEQRFGVRLELEVKVVGEEP